MKKAKDIEKNPGTAKKKSRLWIWILLGILLFLLLLLFSFWLFIDGKLNKIQYDGEQISLNAPADAYPPELPSLEDHSGESADEQSSGKPDVHTPLEIHHEDHVFNILLLGTDDRTSYFSKNARADSIMILSLDMQKHTIKLVSIERGIGVPIPGRSNDLINHTFRYGGAKLTLETVRNCFRVDVKDYIRVNHHAFEKGIDVIGGVDITLTGQEAKALNKFQEKKLFHTGPNHFNGYQALEYSRLRSIDSDWHRIERQRTVIQAAVNRIKSLSLTQLNALADQILPLVQTSLMKNEVFNLLLEAPGFITNGAHIQQMTVPTWETCWNSQVDGRPMIGVDFDANARILRKFFYD